jgi:hypothetical protein
MPPPPPPVCEAHHAPLRIAPLRPFAPRLRLGALLGRIRAHQALAWLQGPQEAENRNQTLKKAFWALLMYQCMLA